MFLKKYFLPIVILCIAGYFIGKYLYMQPKYVNGESAPNFESELLTGEKFELSQLQGKYVLLDFWGTWCAPCLKEIPELKALHEKFAPKGLEVVSVALEYGEKTNRLENAISRKGLHWKYHLIDPIKGKIFDASIATKLYGVREIPTKYLINPDGFIIGVNLSYEEMSKILEKNL